MQESTSLTSFKIKSVFIFANLSINISKHNITSTPRKLSNPHRLPSAPILDSTVDEFPSER